jgi:hypothetical protein
MTSHLSAPDPLEQAKRARAHARSGFLTAVELGQEVRAVTEEAHEHARRNHYGEGWAEAMRRRL